VTFRTLPGTDQVGGHSRWIGP